MNQQPKKELGGVLQGLFGVWLFGISGMMFCAIVAVFGIILTCCTGGCLVLFI